MKRRDALSHLTFITGGSLVASHTFMAGCTPDTPLEAQTGLLNGQQIALLDEIGDVILPTTPSSPGAKAARIGEYMNVMVSDCFSELDQEIFMDGLVKLAKSCDEKYGKDFMQLDDGEKQEFVLMLEEENRNYREIKRTGDPERHYYGLIKGMTMRGYFSSEIGATQALNHVAVPGRWDACIPLEPGQKAYS